MIICLTLGCLILWGLQCSGFLTWLLCFFEIDDEKFRSAFILAIVGGSIGLGLWIIRTDDTKKQAQASQKQLSTSLDQLGASQEQIGISKRQLEGVLYANILFLLFSLDKASRVAGIKQLLAFRKNKDIFEDRKKEINLVTSSGLNLEGVNLWEADLERVDLRDANFKGANLQGANVMDAKLQGAGLMNAELQGANLQGAFYDSNTKFPEDFESIQVGMKIDL